MTAAAWAIGGVLILVAGLWPLRTVLRRPSKGDLDEARSLVSRLDTELDLADSNLPAPARAEARRYLLLAGAALGGTPDRAACRRSIGWARSGLQLIDRS